MDDIITIMKTTGNDFDEMQVLFRRMFDIYSEDQNVEYPYTEAGINYLKHRIATGTALVAKTGQTVRGFITFSIQNAIDFKTYDKFGFIENMFIAEAYRQQKSEEHWFRSFWTSAVISI